MSNPDHAARWALEDEELESLMIGATPDDLGRVGNPVAEFFADARNARSMREPTPDRTLVEVFGGDLAPLDVDDRPRMSAPPHPSNGSSYPFAAQGHDFGPSVGGTSGWAGPEAAPITGAHDVRPRRGAHDAFPSSDPGLTVPAADAGLAGDPFAARPNDLVGDPVGADPYAARPNGPFADDPYGAAPGDPFADDPYGAGAPTMVDAPLRGSLLAERTAAHNRLVVPPTEAPTTSVGAFLSQVFAPTAPKVLMGVAMVAVMFTAGQLLGLYSLPFLGGGGVDNQAITSFDAQTEGGIVGQDAEVDPAAPEQVSSVPAEVSSSLITVPLPDVATPLTASTTTPPAPRNTTTPTVAASSTETTVEETTTSVDDGSSTTVDPSSSTTDTTDSSTSSSDTTDTTADSTTTDTTAESTTTESSDTTAANNE